MCEETVTVSAAALTGVCGDAHLAIYYGQNNLSSGHTDLCSVGQLSNFSGPSGTGWYSWQCLGINGGATASCTASEDRCGDGALDAGDYANIADVHEQCDV